MKTFYQAFLALLLVAAVPAAAQAPLFNSYPSAEAVIYLDFDGHTVNGTSWNYNGPIVCESANISQEKIAEVFNRIAEDYRPFNINVTTDSAKYAAAPAAKRMRAIFTTSHNWYGSGAGGVAYINSFSWGDNTPCFVFTALFNYNVKNISEGGSHEIGHTLGLSHQASYNASCAKTSDYNYGTGNGETGWAPIMGVGYYQNFTVWHNGSDPYGCNNVQNDLSIITNSYNGFGYRADDHSNMMPTATEAAFTTNRFAVNGVISKTDDVDVFKFRMPQTGGFKLSAVPYNVGTGNTGSDLDLQIDLLDGSKKVIGSYNPGNALSSVVDTMLTSGVYYLKVDGQGNQYASEYGSLGSYSLEGIYTDVSTLPLRNLELKGNAEGGKHSLSWTVDADEKIVSQEVEVSEDGRTYRTLDAVAGGARTFEYMSVAAGLLHYRLQVLFDNGKLYYSNMIGLKSGTIPAPHLQNSLVRSGALNVNSPGRFTYSILDYQGRQVLGGSLLRGTTTLDISHISTGSYLFRFTNGQQQFVEKFVKQ
jgi:hypothetical protein